MFLLSDKEKKTPNPNLNSKHNSKKTSPTPQQNNTQTLIVGRMSLQVYRFDLALVSSSGFKYGQKSYLKELMGNVIFLVENTKLSLFYLEVSALGY